MACQVTADRRACTGRALLQPRHWPWIHQSSQGPQLRHFSPRPRFRPQSRRRHYRQDLPLSPNPPMDGARTAEVGKGVTGAMIRTRIRVDGRLAGGLQALLGAPMAACSGCGEQDGGIGHGKRRSRTGMARVGGDVQLTGWRVRGGRAPSGWEWNGSQPGQGAAELGFPRPMLGKMQGEAARRAGEPSR